jgi:hypothetical protein
MLAAFGLLFVSSGKAQENYRKIFSSDYERAIHFLQSEQKWMDEIIVSYGLEPREVKAIIFPELIRYNSIQDKIETFALESLYIQYGKAYANFSIGPFQIKPSFAENVEIDFLRKIDPAKSGVLDTTQTINARDSRLQRLKNSMQMLRYVCMFFNILERKYPSWNSEEEKIKFFASAYNSNYRNRGQEIRNFATKKFFHTGLAASKKYSYADIAWFFYNDN